MHYHVVRIDEQGEHVDPALTFDRQDEAEERAIAVAREIVDGSGWSGTRYPGRSWRRGELAVYLDRRVFERQVPRLELSIVRCDVHGRKPVPGCYASRGGLPWWKVEPLPAVPSAAQKRDAHASQSSAKEET